MGNGAGYIRKRGKNSFLITISLGRDESGKQRQASKTVRGTEKDAQAEMARMIVERDKGVDLKPQTVTCSELIARWQATRVPDLAPSTAATYTTLLRVHVEPVLGRLKLRDVRPLHIEAIKSAV